MEAIFVMALAYTVMSSDNHRTIAVGAPNAVITIASPAAYPDKFCIGVMNMNFAIGIKIVSGAPIRTPLSDKVGQIVIFPQSKTALKLERGIWSEVDSCSLTQ